METNTWTASPRWKSTIAADGLNEESRRTSNNSSTSSEILVASGQPSMAFPPPQPSLEYLQPTTSITSIVMAATPSTATVVNGKELRIRFNGQALEKLRAILESTAAPQLQASDSASTHPESEEGDEYDEPDEINNSGLDLNKTYSKEETLRHPGVEFVHRGQGRYRMVAAIKNNSPAPLSRPTRQAAERNDNISEETKEEMFKLLIQHFNEHRKKINPLCKPNWSPSQKHQVGLIMKLLRETPSEEWSIVPQFVNEPRYADFVRDWVTAMEDEFSVNLSGDSDVFESRTRRARQAKVVPDIDHRRSSRAHAQSNNVFDSDEDEDDPMDVSGSDEPFHQLGGDGTVHEDDLHKYPGERFHHRGNKRYRFGLAPGGKSRGNIMITPTGEKRKYHEYASDAEEGEDGSNDGDAHEDDHTAVTYSKAYVNSHPETKFVHRGKGRYRRASDLKPSEVLRKKRKLDTSATPTATSDRRSSRADISLTKEYAESHVSDEAFRNGRPKRESKSRIDPFEMDDTMRSTTGNGKQVRRTSIQAAAKRAMPTVETAPIVDEGLVTSDYVDAHPNETFHHRGQGKWARGLPPPGANGKTAVRGPDKGKPWKAEVERIGIDVDADGNRPPGLADLVLKVDGPDKWPNLRWVYRGGAKWCRSKKEELIAAAAAASLKQNRTSGVARGNADGLEDPKTDVKLAAGAARFKAKAHAVAKLQKPPKVPLRRKPRSVPDGAGSNPPSKAPTPRPALLPPEDDVLTELDLPDLLKDEWSEDETNDLASRILRQQYQPITGPEPFVRALTKHDPAVRSLENLKQVASNAHWALEQLQREFLELDKIVAVHPMNGKKERKPVKGGKVTVDTTMFEDRKEATLYDYNFDPRKIGYQDPEAQKIIRGDDGRELRRRRHRLGADSTLPNGVNYGDGEMTAKRTVKPVSRFDGVVVQPPRKRSRLTSGAATPDESRATTPVADDANDRVHSRGRWKDHIPKRVQELRHESVGSARSASEDPGAKSPGSSANVRKGRPPGSKNLHKRKDAGIKKGPRKPKLASSGSNDGAESEVAGPESVEGSPTPSPAVMLEDLVAGVAPMSADGGGTPVAVHLQ